MTDIPKPGHGGRRPGTGAKVKPATDQLLYRVPKAKLDYLKETLGDELFKKLYLEWIDKLYDETVNDANSSSKPKS